MTSNGISIINGGYHSPMRKSGRERVFAFIDESGAAGGRDPGNEFFILGAVVIHESTMDWSHKFLEDMRTQLRRRSGEHLHFKKVSCDTGQRGLAANLMASPYLGYIGVAVHKRAFPADDEWTHDNTYFWALTLMLERLSWVAKRKNRDVEVTIAHKQRMTKEALRAHEDLLRHGRGVAQGNRIEWDHCRKLLRISTPKETEQLQLADFFVSMVGAALNGETQQRIINESYVRALGDRIWCDRRGNCSGYGMKVHPATSTPGWVRAL